MSLLPPTEGLENLEAGQSCKSLKKIYAALGPKLQYSVTFEENETEGTTKDINITFCGRGFVRSEFFHAEKESPRDRRTSRRTRSSGIKSILSPSLS